MAAKDKRARKTAKRQKRTKPSHKPPRSIAMEMSGTTTGIAGERGWHVSAGGSGKPPLEGKAVLITGGARRVGATLARTLQAAGANVMIHYRNSATEARAL